MNAAAPTEQSSSFSVEDFKHPVTAQMIGVFNQVWDCLAEPGNWWSARERIAIADEARHAKPRAVFERNRTPVVQLSHQVTSGVLSDLVVDTVERVATESGQLSKEWCHEVCEIMGEGAYIELLAIVILTLPIDRFCLYTNTPLKAWPEPVDGEPARAERVDLVDIDGWVKITQSAFDDKELVNVSRAVSQAERENHLRRELVDALYMQGHSFFEAEWSRKSLSRPQLEIAATRTSLINQCFYCAHGHSAILDIASKAIGESASIEATLGESDTDIGVPQGELILEYTELANREPERAYEMFPKLSEALTEKGAVELAATVAIFNGLNRTSDPTGMPMEDTLMAYGRVMGAKRFASLEQLTGRSNVKGKSWLRSVFILVGLKVRRLFSDTQ